MSCFIVVFFFNDTATTEIYTLSLHDALPICGERDGEDDRDQHDVPAGECTVRHVFLPAVGCRRGTLAPVGGGTRPARTGPRGWCRRSVREVTPCTGSPGSGTTPALADGARSSAGVTVVG